MGRGGAGVVTAGGVNCRSGCETFPDCFAFRVRCVPNWVYWLAGGLTEPLPLAGLPRGRYRLTVYAWDWAGNTSALDYRITLPLGSAASAAGAESGPLAPNFDYP
jgi:hypothetical protein